MDTPPIDEPTARVWLAHELKEAACVVMDDVDVPLTPGEEAALEDFVYNLGAGNFASSTLLRKLNRGDYVGAADQLELWDHAGGKVLAGLLRRREAEKKLFFGG
jgi:lysozyme